MNNDLEVNDTFDDLDAAMASKKRGRDAALVGKGVADVTDLDDKKNRGNYRCSRCNLPKKGHVCPFQPRYRRREGSELGSAMVRDESAQAELDEEMTVRVLGDLNKQGTSESYFLGPTASRLSLSTLNESFQNVTVDRKVPWHKYREKMGPRLANKFPPWDRT